MVFQSINQLDALYNNSTLQKGTVIIYTAISSPLSALNKVVVDSFNLQKLYKKCKVLFTNKSIDLFYGYLYKLGVREVREYEEKSPTFVKKYGYFTVE